MLLERVEAEVSEREHQLVGIRCGITQPVAEVLRAEAESDVGAKAMELSRLRAELQERDQQLRNLQQELVRTCGAVFSQSGPHVNEDLRPEHQVSILPPPERSCLAS